jgi:hypothetical protein
MNGFFSDMNSSIHDRKKIKIRQDSTINVYKLNHNDYDMKNNSIMNKNNVDNGKKLTTIVKTKYNSDKYCIQFHKRYNIKIYY